MQAYIKPVMKTVTIISKRSADGMLIDSLFSGPVTMQVIRYDMGKYRESGIGKEIRVEADVMAVFSKRGRDKDGPYYGLWCLVGRAIRNNVNK